MKKLFEELVAATNQMVAEEGGRTSASYGTPFCWTELATFWSEHPTFFKGIFFEALHHIASGVYSRKIPRYTQRFRILSLVEEVILTSNQALEQWQHVREYDEEYYFLCTSAVHSPFKKYWNSQALLSAARSRFLLLTSDRIILWKYSSANQLSVLQREELHFARVSEQRFESFKSVVSQLAPKLADRLWDVCLSEENFFAELKDACGVDFSEHPEAFDIACNLVWNKGFGTYYRTLFKYEDIPEEVVSLVWPDPDKMKKELCAQFRWLCSAKPWERSICGLGTCAANEVRESWAYKQLLQWLDDKTVTYTRKMRSNLMLIGTGTHPYTSRQNQKAKKSTVA